MGNTAHSMVDSIGPARKMASRNGVGGMFAQLGVEPIVGGNTGSNYGLYGQPKQTGDYAQPSGYRDMMQRLYGTPWMMGQYLSAKSASQPSAMNSVYPFAQRLMTPYWASLVKRFMW